MRRAWGAVVMAAGLPAALLVAFRLVPRQELPPPPLPVPIPRPSTRSAVELLERIDDAVVTRTNQYPMSMDEVETPEGKRCALLLHPLGEIRFQIHVPVGGRIELEALMHPVVLDRSDGAAVEVSVRPADLERRRLLSWLFTPTTRPEDRVAASFTIDLSRWEGQDVWLYVRSFPGTEGRRESDWLLLSRLAISGLIPPAEAGGVVHPALRGDRPNVALVSIDTLRADHVGCYGDARGLTPGLDRLSRQGWLGVTHLAEIPGTLPSHVSMLSGLHPWHHGVWPPSGHIPVDMPLVPDVLESVGYRTLAFTDAGFVAPEWGFGWSFFQYLALGGGLRLNLPRLVAALDDQADLPARPLFLFMHTYGVHDPYRAPDPWWSYVPPVEQRRRELLESNLQAFWTDDVPISSEVVAYNRRVYARALAAEDHQLSRLLRLLGTRLTGPLAVVVTSDHGEEFLDHGGIVHWQLYEELLRVPLLVSFPGARPRLLAGMSEVADVAPTLLAVARAPLPPGLDGRPLTLDRQTQPVVSETFKGWLFAARWGDLKLLSHPTDEGARELYDLARDPGELSNLAGAQVGAELMELLQRFVATGGQRSAGETRMSLETSRQLKALGYID